MAHVVIDIKIMPKSPEENLEKIREEAEKMIVEYEGNVIRHEIRPIAFGLSAVIITFGMDEAKGSTDDLEEKMSSIKGVNSVEVIGARRAFG